MGNAGNIGNIEAELKGLVISTLNLENMSPSDIVSEQPLFGEGLGLDSIDALEIGVAIKKKYNVALSVDDGEVKRHFHSIKTLAEFIQRARQVTA